MHPQSQKEYTKAWKGEHGSSVLCDDKLKRKFPYMYGCDDQFQYASIVSM